MLSVGSKCAASMQYLSYSQSGGRRLFRTQGLDILELPKLSVSGKFNRVHSNDDTLNIIMYF